MVTSHGKGSPIDKGPQPLQESTFNTSVPTLALTVGLRQDANTASGWGKKALNGSTKKVLCLTSLVSVTGLSARNCVGWNGHSIPSGIRSFEMSAMGPWSLIHNAHLRKFLSSC